MNREFSSLRWHRGYPIVCRCGGGAEAKKNKLPEYLYDEVISNTCYFNTQLDPV